MAKKKRKFSPAQIRAQKLFAKRAKAGTLKKKSKLKIPVSLASDAELRKQAKHSNLAKAELEARKRIKKSDKQISAKLSDIRKMRAELADQRKAIELLLKKL